MKTPYEIGHDLFTRGYGISHILGAVKQDLEIDEAFRGYKDASNGIGNITMTMDKRVEEALGILQEECAEVIQEVSKCRRFGLNSLHYKTGIKHSTMLELEVGDVLALVDILVEQGILDRDGLEIATENKKQKLEQWSGIYVKD